MDQNDRAQESEGSWSLPVPSVQEMVRKDSLSVPERYIQNFKDQPQYCSICEDASEVPVINFSLLVNGDEDQRKTLDLACREWGFFQMIDHGVAEVLQKMKSAAAAFFDLSMEEKKKYAKAKINDFQGYGQINVVSDQHKLDWCDVFFLMILPQKYKQLWYWPLDIPGFREAVEVYAAEICKLNEVILANLSILMGLKDDGLKKLQGELMQGVRMNYYPPCSRPDAVLGINPHSDTGFLTYLIQDDEISGLQIKHNGDWIAVKPIPDAIVVNVGDCLECWSNGLYKSVEHRAVTNKSAARMSIAVPMNPAQEAEISPVETMVDNLNRPVMYKSIKYLDYVKQKLSKRVDGKASIEFLKI